MTVTAWEVALPEPWGTAPIEHAEPLAEVTLIYGNALLALGRLADGTNFIALTWPAGQRIARLGPHTDWALEEHYSGRVPRADAAKVDEVWAKGVDCLIAAKKAAEAELGPPPRSSHA